MSKSPFETLAAINVNERVEKKNGLSYLSWAWAVDQLMRADPAATWAYGEPQRWGETVMVFCTVTAFGKPMTAQLPVMDHRNKAIANPDAFAVNTAMQRCLVKAIALHGLGLYIYAGEDLPAEVQDKRASELEDMAMAMIDAHQNGKDLEAVKIWYDATAWAPDAETKMEEQAKVWGMLRQFSALRSAIKANKPEPVAA